MQVIENTEVIIFHYLGLLFSSSSVVPHVFCCYLWQIFFYF